MRTLNLAILIVSLFSASVTTTAQAQEQGQGMATVIFMRPSIFGGLIKSSVFDITSGKNEVIGILSAEKKLSYRVSPGEHFFMVIGENADFMRAELEAGKTYYCRVRVRMGAWKARFSLEPIRQTELDGEEFLKWQKKTEQIENRDQARVWAAKHAQSIEDKHVKYLRKWEKKSDEEKSEYTLRKEDGR
jgi:hypothetical protein